MLEKLLLHGGSNQDVVNDLLDTLQTLQSFNTAMTPLVTTRIKPHGQLLVAISSQVKQECHEQ